VSKKVQIKTMVYLDSAAFCRLMHLLASAYCAPISLVLTGRAA
jgi:hypothetical protein